MHKRIFPQLLLASVGLLLLVTPIFSQAGPPSGQPAWSGHESLPELVKRVKPTVVAIATYDSQGEALMTGSGFFLRPGQVVTNLHVLRGAQRCEIKTLDGKGKVFPVAGTLAVDEEGDLALLSVEMPPDRPRTSELARVLPDEGEQIVVIGNPLKLEGSVTDGIVSAVREVPNLGKIIQITAPISHGNSGSPVFNMKGQVVGVVTVKVTNGQNINLAIGAARVELLRRGPVAPNLQSSDQRESWRCGGVVISNRTGFPLAGQLRQRHWLFRNGGEQKSAARRRLGAGWLLQS